MKGKKRDVTKPSLTSSDTSSKLRQVFCHMLSGSFDRRQFIASFMRQLRHKRRRRPNRMLHVLLECVNSRHSDVTTSTSSSTFSSFTSKTSSSTTSTSSVLAANFLALLRRCEPGPEQDAYDQLWRRLLQLPMSRLLCRRVLLLLPSHVLPRLARPLALTDYLVAAYDRGGVDSILALHGVFELMQRHNLEYPRFYDKLYSLLEPNALRTAHTARFLRLVDLFLSSDYLPLYLVAAFVKRLARLCLGAPTPLQRPLLVLVCNLTVRHPGLRPLLDDPRGPTTLSVPGDPFRLLATDGLEHCRALDSSLWEVATLRRHIWPQAARAASFVGGGRVERERPVSELLDSDYSCLINKELNRKVRDMPLTFHRPQGLLSCAEDSLCDLWTM